MKILLIILTIIFLAWSLYITKKYFDVIKEHNKLVDQQTKQLQDKDLYISIFNKKELEVLKQSVEYHINLLTNAGMKEQDKQKKAKYLLTKNTMLDIQKKLEEK